jgi:hypothetical protein
MLVQLYVSETHHAEIASAITMNLEMELPTTAAIAKCVDSLINVLGPDLQDAVKSRELILTMMGQFQREDDVKVQLAALGCLEHLSLYAPGYMHFGEYVKLLQKYLSSDNTTLRDVAIDGLYNTMKRDPRDVLREADAVLQEEIRAAGLYRELWQSFCVLPDIRTVGVQGDERTYGYVVVIRAVTSDDAMTADWARLPYDLLERVASRMINEIAQVNRVTLDITSKPPGTIEWE